MKILFSVFSWWETSAIIFKKRYFIGGFSGVKKGENDFKAPSVFSRK